MNSKAPPPLTKEELDHLRETIKEPIVFGVRGGDQPASGADTMPSTAPTPTVMDVPFQTKKESWQVEAWDKNHPLGVPPTPPRPKRSIPFASQSKQEIKTRCPKCERGLEVDVVDEEEIGEESNECEDPIPETETEPQPQGYLCQFSQWLEPMNWPVWVRSILCMNM